MATSFKIWFPLAITTYIIKFLYIYDNDIVFSNEVALKKDLAKRLGGATKAFSKDLEAKETGHDASLS